MSLLKFDMLYKKKSLICFIKKKKFDMLIIDYSIINTTQGLESLASTKVSLAYVPITYLFFKYK